MRKKEREKKVKQKSSSHWDEQRPFGGAARRFHGRGARRRGGAGTGEAAAVQEQRALQGLQRSAVREHGAERTQPRRRRNAAHRALNSSSICAKWARDGHKAGGEARAELEIIDVRGGGGCEEGRDNEAVQRRQNVRVGEEGGGRRMLRLGSLVVVVGRSFMQVPVLDPARAAASPNSRRRFASAA